MFNFQLKGKSYQNLEVASSDDSLSKDVVKEVSDEEKQDPILELEHDIHVNEELVDSTPINSGPPTKEELIDENPIPPLEKTAAQNFVIANDVFPEGEEGWQPVQRPRSAGSYGRRLRQKKSAFNKFYGHQKKDLLHDSEEKLKNNFQNGKYHFIKKRASYADQHTAKVPSPNHKFGRRIVKGLTYRVKSVPVSTPEEISSSGKEESNSSFEVGPTQTTKEASHVPQRSSLVSIGRSPSYKEVALAPPGTISLLQVESQSDIPDDKEIDNGKSDDFVKPKEISESEIVEEKVEVENLKDETEETHLSELVGDEDTETVPENFESDKIIDKSVIDIQIPIASDLSEKDSATNVITGDDKSTVNSPNFTQELPNKKLSASATPFNPTSPPVRVAPIPMNIALPPGPTPWQMNMNLHPRPTNVLPGGNPMCSSPHQPYPTPPGTPNIIHPMPLMYSPPFTQAPSLPMTTSSFHPNHFAWQCNMGANGLQYVTGPVWPNGHPMEFSVSPPAVRPISDPMVEAKQVEIETKQETDFEGTKVISEIVGVKSEDIGSNWNLGGTGDNHVLKPHRKVENEKTFNILIRGRRNRKQTLRMPISLLNKPYNSQSFKVVYSRVIKGSEGPKSASFSSEGNEETTAA